MNSWIRTKERKKERKILKKEEWIAELERKKERKKDP